MKKITSADQALKESLALKSVWSNESHLSQLILIYVAKLLERKTVKTHRKPSEWQKHLSKYLRSGKTIQEAAKDWHKRS